MSQRKPRTDTVHPLHGNQMHAVAPDRTVWLGASAGTGKTQVLTARVLRLLLEPGVEPDQILCLTFTRAGAAEMAERVSERLADWVRLKDTDLALHLDAIGAPIDPDTRRRARSRFAAVLDCPGGGIRIETIHAFSQWLLAAFPEEAGLRPGSRALEDRERDLLVRQVLVDLILRAEAEGDSQFSRDLETLSLRLDQSELIGFLQRCARAGDLWTGPLAWQPPLRPHLCALIGPPRDAGPALLAAQLVNDVFPVNDLARCRDALTQWKTATGSKMAASVSQWLDADPATRLALLDGMRGLILTQKNTAKEAARVEKFDPDYADHMAPVIDALLAFDDLVAQLALVDHAEPALAIGRRFALAFAEAKVREGFIDFDDQIAAAAALLTRREAADWIRFKLDRQFDHLLVDEAQDTNAEQWGIVLDGLAGDFFAGAGKPGDGPDNERSRTLFVVGDYKQAIYRFQGTSPTHFEAARQRVARDLRSLADAAGDPARELAEYGLDRSFRSAQPLLDFVDRVLSVLGPARLGLPQPPDRHVGHDIPGLVRLWQPVGLARDDADEDDDIEADSGPEDWLSAPERKLAAQIAATVRHWLDHGFALTKGKLRRAQPGDVMVLVRQRGALASLIVARLHAEGVPVAGVDRLRLGAPLAVRDLLAALRFAVQPGDDLNLACLLTSPLIGWSQEDLLRHGHRAEGTRLWDHLRASEGPATHHAMARLRELLARADFLAPAALLQWILVGPWRGMQALVARLGEEARDPVNELVNAALAHAAAHVPGLATFLHWFEAGDGDVKREAGGQGGLVRVMTVHGSKGLQAPIVILADATRKADSGTARTVTIEDSLGRKVPLPRLRKAETPASIAAIQATEAALDLAEHWRLLYVAMTRAEEALFVTGALKTRDKGVVPADSWYAVMAEAMGDRPAARDPVWGEVRDWGKVLPPPPPDQATGKTEAVAPPDCLDQPIGAEPRPARPLTPSALGEDSAPAAPTRPGPGARSAARRGTLLHRLLERLPDCDPATREAAAHAWLARTAPDLAGAERAAMAASALAVLADPRWSEVFGPGSLAEVPVAALVGTRLVSGTIDRLLITPDLVRIVDFKTDRRPPDHLGAIAPAYLRQMAAYVAAMEVIHPGRRVEAALLFTATPHLFALPDDLIIAQKLGLGGEEESFSP